MSPKLTCLLTLAGVALAGTPLLHLTQRRPLDQAELPPPPQEASARQPIHLSLRFTGEPTSLILRYEGEEVAALPPETPSPWETHIDLPLLTSSVELELEAAWSAAHPEHVVTLELSPRNLPSRTETQWTGRDGSLLHTIFTFSWR